MNREQYLLCVAGEEASEVSQMASKNQRFGLHEVFPGQPLTNAQRMHLELDDLMAMVEMLNEEFGFDYAPNRERIDAKKAKVNAYGAFSASLGLVSASGPAAPTRSKPVLKKSPRKQAEKPMPTSAAMGCPDCAVEPGKEHRRGCDVERCPKCGGQAISCGHRRGALSRLKWTGQWPGEAECSEFGWYAKFSNGAWVRCAAFDEGAQPDLNRLAEQAQWSADLGRFVLPVAETSTLAGNAAKAAR